jgi:hypothetical protein
MDLRIVLNPPGVAISGFCAGFLKRNSSAGDFSRVSSRHERREELLYQTLKEPDKHPLEKSGGCLSGFLYSDNILVPRLF